MTERSDIAAIGNLLADQGRAAIIIALLEGHALPAGQLARIAGISASTASSHLSRLLRGGLVSVQSQGRHRYYALAGPEVAHAVETLSAITRPLPPRSLKQSIEAKRLSFARVCYNHLAGKLGVMLADAMVAQRHLIPHDAIFELTQAGIIFFESLGIDPRKILGSKYPNVTSCIDWTERRRHISGPLATALLKVVEERGLVRRAEAERRGLEVSTTARLALSHLIGHALPDFDKATTNFQQTDIVMATEQYNG